MTTADVYIIGLSMHPAQQRETRYRLEEMVFHTTQAALANAGISRRQLDNVVLGACDELDGRPISSMLMAAPAGGLLTDEIKVTDSGASALCLGYARIRSGDFHAGLVTSWCKPSKTDVDTVMRLRGDPFFTRPLDIDSACADGLFAQAVSRRFDVSGEEAARRARAAFERAARNPRGLRHEVPSLEAIRASEHLATPLRSGHAAPFTDGAVTLVLASKRFLKANPQCKPLARMTGAGWASDSYRLGSERLSEMHSATAAWNMALAQAGVKDASDFDVVEVESPTSWHEAAYSRIFGVEGTALSPSGGSFAQNPLFCSGLVNAAEAVLQVAQQAGPVQVQGARRAAAHSCHGFAQQGNVVVTFEQAGAA